MQTRIYLVEGPDSVNLVEATSAAQAIRHVVTPKFKVKVASTKELAGLLSKGNFKIELGFPVVSTEPTA